MKKIIYFNLIVLFALLAVSCKKKSDDLPIIIKPKVNTVSQFVYDGMSLFYLWADEMVNKKPSEADTIPKEYFYGTLNPIDREHGWSWITDDIYGLLKDFEGEETDAFGFSPTVLWANEAMTKLVAFVRYVYPNTPAAEVGLKRGDVITKINGQEITASNYLTLFGANQEITFTVLDQNFANPKEVQITPRSFSTDPVLFSDIYEIDGKKIAYLFYTGFNNKYNNSLYDAFSKFKEAGATDLVLDLRYNPGGSISAAIYLASLIAPEAVVANKSPFTKMSYNTFINEIAEKDNWDVVDYLGKYDTSTEQNPLNANLNLNKVYILATSSSASASELTTFCLRPYMDVVHIGEQTSGKYTASWTIHAYDNFKKDGRPRAQPAYFDSSKLSTAEKNALKNWAMQLIVGKYTDKDGKDFIKEGTLTPDYPIKTQERSTETWKPIGDVEDYLFSKAISLITGKEPVIPAAQRVSSKRNLIEAEIYSPTENIIRNSINQDNIHLRPEQIQKLMERVRGLQE